jgi:hypothetical protein
LPKGIGTLLDKRLLLHTHPQLPRILPFAP